MSSIITRRSLLRGLLAAPAIVAAASLMPIRGIVVPVAPVDWNDLLRQRMDAAYEVFRNTINENLYTISGLDAWGAPITESIEIPNLLNIATSTFSFKQIANIIVVNK